MQLDGSSLEDESKLVWMDNIIKTVFGAAPTSISLFNTNLSVTDLSSIIAGQLNRIRSNYEEDEIMGDAENNLDTDNGRIGPKVVRVKRHKPIEVENMSYCEEGLHLISKGNFASMRTNTCVFKGKWMFETTIETAGIQQIGWATLSCPFTNEAGVGDSPNSYSFDGKRQMKWSSSHKHYGEGWAEGDIIGSCIDLNNQTISFYRNGKDLGVAFSEVAVAEEGMAYFPTVSLSYGEKCFLNFGAIPFVYPVEGYSPMQSGAQLILEQSQYLLGCVRQLLPLISQWEDSHHATIFDMNDLVLLFAGIFEFYAPLLAKHHAALVPLVEWLITLDQRALGQFCELVQVCFESEESFAFVKNLLWEISYRARTASWIPPSQGSVVYLQLCYYLIQSPLISHFMVSNPNEFRFFLENVLQVKLPTQIDLETIFPTVSDEENQKAQQEFTCIATNCKNREQYIVQLFRFLLESQRELFLEFLRSLIRKNKGANQNIPPWDLSSPSCLHTVFIGVLDLIDNFLANPGAGYPYSRFVDKTREYYDFPRIGGGFNHLAQNEPLTQLHVPSVENEQVLLQSELFETALFLLDLGVVTQLSGVGDRLILQQDIILEIINKQKRGVQLQPALVAKKWSCTRSCLWDKVLWMREWHLQQFWNIVTRLGYMLQEIQTQDSALFSYVPEFYFEVLIDLFFALRKGTSPLFPFTSEVNQAGLQIVLTVLISNLTNPKVLNPDLKEKILLSVTHLFASANFLRQLEINNAALTELIPALLEIFDSKYFWIYVADLMLNFVRGTTFGVRSPSESSSLIFMDRFAEIAKQRPDSTNRFLNKLYNYLNSAVTEFRLALKDLKEIRLYERENSKKKCTLMFDLFVKMLKMLEFISLRFPEVLLESKLNMTRLSELLLLALATTSSSGAYANYFDNFVKASLRSSKVDGTAVIFSCYGPVAGIAVNLSSFYNQASAEQQQKYTNICSSLVQLDGVFDMSLFECLSTFQWSKSKSNLPGLQEDLLKLELFMQELKTTVAEYKPADSNMEVDDDSNDDLCSICYANPLDSVFLPCKHQSCSQCISRHLLDNNKCFFCKAAIQEVIPLTKST